MKATNENDVNAIPAVQKDRLPAALWALALCLFAFGTNESVVPGLLLKIASDLKVSTSSAGLLVSGYAIGVVVGALLVPALTRRLPRKTALLVLMGWFVAGNLLCSLAPGYAILMTARVITGLCHAALFGLGSVIAAELVAPDKRASAIAIMFSGLTLAYLASAFNIAAFNVGSAGGAYLGGVVVDSGFGLNAVPLAGAFVTAVAISVTAFSWSLDLRTRSPVRTVPV